MLMYALPVVIVITHYFSPFSFLFLCTFLLSHSHQETTRQVTLHFHGTTGLPNVTKTPLDLLKGLSTQVTVKVVIIVCPSINQLKAISRSSMSSTRLSTYLTISHTTQQRKKYHYVVWTSSSRSNANCRENLGSKPVELPTRQPHVTNPRQGRLDHCNRTIDKGAPGLGVNHRSGVPHFTKASEAGH